jgi:hypothetical protein
MKSRRGFSAMLVLVLVGGAEALPTVAEGQSRGAPFKVELEQEGRRVAIAEHEARLRRAPFDILVWLRDGGTVYLRAAWSSGFFDDAANGRDLRLFFHPSSTAAERPGNPAQELWVHDDHMHAWGYDRTRADHPFDEVVSEGGLYRCRRRVSSVNRIKRVALSDTAASHLYLVFFSGNLSADWMKTRETGRDWLRLVFEPEGQPEATAAAISEPSDALLALLLAPDAATAEAHLLDSTKDQLRPFHPETKNGLGLHPNGMLAPRGLVLRRAHRDDVVLELLGGAGEVLQEFTLDSQKINGDVATLEGKLKEYGGEYTWRARMRKERGRWCLAGIERGDAPPTTPAMIAFAALDDPRFGDRFGAIVGAADEAAVVEELRALIPAIGLYRALNGGLFDRLECLAQPQACVGGRLTTPLVAKPTPGSLRAVHTGASSCPASRPRRPRSVRPGHRRPA